MVLSSAFGIVFEGPSDIYLRHGSRRIASSTGMHCLPATSLAANENHFRCFASFTSPKKNSYGMRKRLRKFMASLESRRFSSAFPEQYRPQRLEEVRSWVDLPSALDAGTITILDVFPPCPLHVLYFIARPKSAPTRPVCWLGAVPCINTSRATASFS